MKGPADGWGGSCLENSLRETAYGFEPRAFRRVATHAKAGRTARMQTGNQTAHHRGTWQPLTPVEATQAPGATGPKRPSSSFG